MTIKPRKLIILRSLPGGGKSTLTKQLVSKYEEQGCCVKVHSTDDYHFRFNNDKWVYEFDKENLYRYHKRNQTAVATSMDGEFDVIIVDNTNITFSEIKPYVILAILFDYEIELIEPDTPWKFDVEECVKHTIHGVPLENIKRMLSRWESSDDCYKKIDELRKIIKDFK